MSRLVGFFDCFLARRFLTGDDTGRVQNEQNMATSLGYCSESSDTTGNSAQETGPRFQGPLSNEVLERPDGEDYYSTFVPPEYSSDYSETEGRTRIRSRDERSALEFVNEWDAMCSRLRCSSSSTSDFSDDSGTESDTDDDEGEEEEEQGGGIFYRRRYAWEGGVGCPPNRTLTRPLRLLPSEDMVVIGALYRHPEVYPVPRETEWRDLTRTMTRLGFSVTPARGGGSARRFEVVIRSDLIPAGSEGEVVTAHEPHGGRTTLGRNRMRQIGRRLTNAFGWSAETFGRA
ncbi:hypothetical protein F5B21DRAFT_503949 [Xylaria acuta]|nr:hypothetical protein F5B21DRAFT_503949 [Xylaria acuta]